MVVQVGDTVLVQFYGSEKWREAKVVEIVEIDGSFDHVISQTVVICEVNGKRQAFEPEMLRRKETT